MVLYLSSVKIDGERIPATEWLFYLVMAVSCCFEFITPEPHSPHVAEPRRMDLATCAGLLQSEHGRPGGF